MLQNPGVLKILVIDDEKISRLKIKSHLRDHLIIEAGSYSEALERLDDQYDICFIDLNLDDQSTELFGLEILKLTVKKGIYSVIMSSLSDEEIIEHAYSLGCNDYYSKGKEAESIKDTIHRFFLKKNNHTENYFFSEVLPTKSVLQKNAVKNIIPFFESDMAICILGESGTGKTYLARKIHEQSKRAGQFVEVNCGALSEELLDAELFGHSKGAFTGATSDNKGKLFLANKGTLFLDEIGSMSESMQAKLLKAIEEKTFYQVNSDKIIHSDFRIICATLDNLEEKIKKGQFRFDLFQRICGLNIKLISLRSRKEDILDLLKKGVDRESNDSRKLIFSKEAKEALLAYNWPGNIRELNRLCQLLSKNQNGLISKDDISNILSTAYESQKEVLVNSTQIEFAKEFGLNALLEQIEKEIITSTLKEHNFGIRKTMALLKINQAKVYKYSADGKPHIQ